MHKQPSIRQSPAALKIRPLTSSMPEVGHPEWGYDAAETPWAEQASARQVTVAAAHKEAFDTLAKKPRCDRPGQRGPRGG